MSLLLYHFTGAPFIAQIQREGLTKGVLPWNLNKYGKPTFKTPFQWLTTNADYSQPWCLLGSLPFARNAHRITVLIPPNQMQHVLKWSELVRRCQPDCAGEINATGGDVENWRVFHGRIPPSWFLSIDANMGERLSPTAN